MRLLLPFTQHVDICAVDNALMLAQQRGATLVACSLIHQAMQGVQPDPRQPSREFLEVVQQQATYRKVPVARLELSTHNTVESIHVFAQELECEGIVHFLREGTGVLLDTSEVKQVLEEESFPLYLMRLPAKESQPSPPKWHSRWFKRQQGCQGELIQVHSGSARGKSGDATAFSRERSRIAAFPSER